MADGTGAAIFSLTVIQEGIRTSVDDLTGQRRWTDQVQANNLDVASSHFR